MLVGEIYRDEFFSLHVKWYIFEIVGTVVISLRIKKLFSFRDVGNTFLFVMAREDILLNYLCSFHEHNIVCYRVGDFF